MKILTAHISIGNLRFAYVAQVEVTSSWQMFTDTATVKLPAHLKINKDELLQYVHYGDPVRIEAGYDGQRHTLFTGYVTELKPGVPVEIKCEDEMWRLKQESITASERNMSVEKLLNKYYTNYKSDYINVSLGIMIIDNLNKVKVLEQLKGSFGLYSFFRDGKLIVGKIYDPERAVKRQFILDYNMVSDELVFKRKDQVRLKIKAVSVMPDGSKIELETGDDDGDTRTLHFYNLTKNELRAAAEREMKRLKYDGWRGHFTAFGEPFVRHGDIVRLTKRDDTSGDKTGAYWVDKVVYRFGTSGFRQVITLGPRV